MRYRYAHGRLRFPDVNNLASGSHEHHRSVLLEGMTWPAPVVLPLGKRCPLCVAVRCGSEPSLDWVPVLLGICACCCCRRSPSELCSILESRAGTRALLAHSRCRLGPDRTRPSVSAVVSTRAHQLWLRLCKRDASATNSLHAMQLVSMVRFSSLAECM